MALSDILEKIKEETEKKLSQMEKDFQGKKQRLEEKYEKIQKQTDEELHKKVEIKSTKILEKAENLAEMEAKNQLLKAKRELIEEVLDKAVEKMAQTDNYTKIITDMLKKSDIHGENIVVVPARGKERETKEAIQKADKNYFLSDKSANIKGGFILKTSNIEIDNSFETIIKKQLKENIEITINKLLFS